MKMILSFTVQVTVENVEEQNREEFKTEDGASMKGYLKEKIEDAMKGSWQYNAQVIDSTVKVKSL